MLNLRHVILLPAALVILAAGAGAADNGGLIYGKISTRDGKTYTGALRWGTQEAFWDDLFNATKDDNPWMRYARDNEDRKTSDRDRFHIFGMTITDFNFGSNYQHVFLSRFGDIRRIDVKTRGRALITMKSGTEYDASGYGDIGETIQVADPSLGRLKINWDEIRSVEFMPTAASAKAAGYRLKGKVKTREMDLSGWVMWDAEECLSSDVLDGEGEVGTMAIEFANIRSLKRESSQSCTVKLKDGREFELRGSNDVNRENRGIYVEDERYGKVEVPWDEFEEVVYADDDGATGRSYDSYAPARKLEGTVKAAGGKEYTGIIVYDFDEEETCDMLNGKIDEMEFDVPFSKVAAITPKGRHSAQVDFTGGDSLRLEDAQDVTANNSGLLIFRNADDRDPQYVAWEDIEMIRFKK